MDGSSNATVTLLERGSGPERLRRRDNPPVERQPETPHGTPAVPLAAFPRASREPLAEVSVVQEADDPRTRGPVIADGDEQTMYTIRQDGGHAARVGRDHGTAAGECFHDGRRHVVDVGSLQVDVSVSVVAPDIVR